MIRNKVFRPMCRVFLKHEHQLHFKISERAPMEHFNLGFSRWCLSVPCFWNSRSRLVLGRERD